MIVSNNNPTITWHLRQYITLTPDTWHRKRVQASSYGVPGLSVGISLDPILE